MWRMAAAGAGMPVRLFRAIDLGATEAVTVGAGGAGGSLPVGGRGNLGGDSSFGAHCVARGAGRLRDGTAATGCVRIAGRGRRSRRAGERGCRRIRQRLCRWVGQPQQRRPLGRLGRGRRRREYGAAEQRDGMLAGNRCMPAAGAVREAPRSRQIPATVAPLRAAAAAAVLSAKAPAPAAKSGWLNTTVSNLLACLLANRRGCQLLTRRPGLGYAGNRANQPTN